MSSSSCAKSGLRLSDSWKLYASSSSLTVRSSTEEERGARNDWMMDMNMSLRRALSASSRLLISSE